MKKYLIISFSILILIIGIYYVTFYTSFFFFPHHNVNVTFTTSNKEIKKDNQSFEIHAINITSSMPYKDDREHAVDKETFLRWFKLIKEMNINTIRIFTIESPSFYEALKEYNTNNDEPLYLIQGMDVGSYEKKSSIDYFDRLLKNDLINRTKTMVDVIHGRRIIPYNNKYASGNFKSDVSKWTIGYIIGTEWNADTLEYTNQMHEDDNIYEGEYLKTSPLATPFERVLTEIGDNLFKYESKKYGEQRLLSFGSCPDTDPFVYNEAITDYFNKFAEFDMANILSTDKIESGLFASFQAFSGYPDYYRFIDSEEDTYKVYLKKLNDHYQIPVVISEFGYSTARGQSVDLASTDNGIVFTEEEQGKLIVNAINTMKEVGIKNFIIHEWQDNWDRTVWNTIFLSDTTRSKYWHDMQTSSQNFGILSFEDRKVNVDGNKKDWDDNDVVLSDDGYTLSAKYDSTYFYLLVEKDNLDFENDYIYIPFDTTDKTGSSKYQNISFDKDADFILKIHGKDDTELLVQDRYNPLRAVYSKVIWHKSPFNKRNIPNQDSDNFENILMITSYQNLVVNSEGYEINNDAKTVNTGKLTYGIGNPKYDNYNSLSDFYSRENIIEIRIPWSLFNFSDPSSMMIHNDYFEKYGIENYKTNKMYIGVGDGNEKINCYEFTLKGWGKNTQYQERLKASYDIIKEALKED